MSSSGSGHRTLGDHLARIGVIAFMVMLFMYASQNPQHAAKFLENVVKAGVYVLGQILGQDGG